MTANAKEAVRRKAVRKTVRWVILSNTLPSNSLSKCREYNNKKLVMLTLYSIMTSVSLMTNTSDG